MAGGLLHHYKGDSHCTKSSSHNTCMRIHNTTTYDLFPATCVFLGTIRTLPFIYSLDTQPHTNTNTCKHPHEHTLTHNLHIHTNQLCLSWLSLLSCWLYVLVSTCLSPGDPMANNDTSVWLSSQRSIKCIDNL